MSVDVSAQIKKTQPPAENVAKQIEKDLIQTNIKISDWFDKLTEDIDLFLVGRKITTKPTSSRIIVENTTYSRESDNFTNLTTISLLPRFPNLEAYWNLKFTSYERTSIGERNQRGYARATPRQQNYAAEVGFFRRLQDVRFMYQPRVELSSQPQLSHSISLDKVIDYGTYQVNPRLKLFADSDKGTGIINTLNFNFELNETFSLTFTNEGEYEDKRRLYSVLNGVSLGQSITDTSALAYGVSFFSNSRPNYHLDAYSLSVTWSQVLYRNVLDYQISPQLDFVSEEDYRGYAGLIVGFRVYF